MGLSKKRSGKIKKEECLDEGDFSSFLVPKNKTNIYALLSQRQTSNGMAKSMDTVSLIPYSMAKVILNVPIILEIVFRRFFFFCSSLGHLEHKLQLFEVYDSGDDYLSHHHLPNFDWG